MGSTIRAVLGWLSFAVSVVFAVILMSGHGGDPFVPAWFLGTAIFLMVARI